MSIFNFFKRKKVDADVEDKKNENLITFTKSDGADLLQSYEDAKRTFPYFWRELSWEYRRIVPALSIACVKAAFSEDIGEDEPLVEHMWINDVYFDGETITGTLINNPNELSNVKVNDQVHILINDIEDWLFSDGEKVCGGFSIQALRKHMKPKDLKDHDKAWGLPFNDDFSVSLTLSGNEHAAHPMDENMRESLLKFLTEHPTELIDSDNTGNTMLHREVIAGNIESIKVLLEKGANPTIKNNYGKMAKDYAVLYGWQNIQELLASKGETVH